MKSVSSLFPAGALLLLVLLVLTSGCGDYVPNHDIVVVKVHPDGTEAWGRALDYGADDVAGDIIEMENGDLVIAAGSSDRKYESPVPKLVRLSRNGTVIGEHPCPGLNGDLTSLIHTRDMNLSAATFNGQVAKFRNNGSLLGVAESGTGDVWSIAPGPDGSIAVAGRSTERYPAGTVAEFGPDGSVATRSPRAGEAVETPGCRPTVLEAGDKKIPVTECVGEWKQADQASVSLVGRNGTVLWHRGYGAYGLSSVWSIAAAEDGNGYWLYAHGPGSTGLLHQTFVARIAGNGSVLFIRDSGPAQLWFSGIWYVNGSHVRAVVPREHPESKYPIEVRPEAITYDQSGNISARLELFPASRITIPAADGGYFSAGYDMRIAELSYIDTTWRGNEELRALKFRADGSREWERTIRSVKADSIKKVLQTSDGGYVILALKQNR